jgi:hypothetical protein
MDIYQLSNVIKSQQWIASRMKTDSFETTVDTYYIELIHHRWNITIFIAN